jgi:diguanylate cyclase (GGDEF)-like protein
MASTTGVILMAELFRVIRVRIQKAAIISAVVCAVYVLWVSHLSPFKLPGLEILDMFYLINTVARPLDSAVKEVVIISIDDESFKKMNMRWPWRRSIIAEMIEKISLDKPAVICLDLVFIGESVDASDDLRMAKAFKDAGNVMIGSYQGSGGRLVMPDRAIAGGAKEVGFVNKPADSDYTIRRMRPVLFSTSGRIINYALSAKVAAHLLRQNVAETVSGVPLLSDRTAYLYYFGSMDKFALIPAWKILKDDVSRGALKGKMVFIGSTSELLHDNHPTPLGIMPGVVLEANKTLQFLTGRFFHNGGFVLNFAALFMVVFIAVFGSLSFPIIRGIAVSAGAIIIFVALCLVLFLKGVIIEPFGGIFLVATLSVVIYGKRHITLVLDNIELQKEAITDGLTGLSVYRYFELRLKRDLENAAAGKKPLVLIIYDIDHFKEINDVYGHEFGNTVLRAVSKIIKDNSRKYDTVARYGGDELCVLMFDTKNEIAERNSLRVLDGIRRLELTVPDEKKTSVKITISCGMASLEDCAPKTPADFINAADSALYRSKNSGRDRISIYQSEKRREMA